MLTLAFINVFDMEEKILDKIWRGRHFSNSKFLYGTSLLPRQLVFFKKKVFFKKGKEQNSPRGHSHPTIECHWNSRPTR